MNHSIINAGRKKNQNPFSHVVIVGASRIDVSRVSSQKRGKKHVERCVYTFSFSIFSLPLSFRLKAAEKGTKKSEFQSSVV